MAEFTISDSDNKGALQAAKEYAESRSGDPWGGGARRWGQWRVEEGDRIVVLPTEERFVVRSRRVEVEK